MCGSRRGRSGRAYRRPRTASRTPVPGRRAALTRFVDCLQEPDTLRGPLSAGASGPARLRCDRRPAGPRTRGARPAQPERSFRHCAGRNAPAISKSEYEWPPRPRNARRRAHAMAQAHPRRGRAAAVHRLAGAAAAARSPAPPTGLRVTPSMPMEAAIVQPMMDDGMRAGRPRDRAEIAALFDRLQIADQPFFHPANGARSRYGIAGPARRRGGKAPTLMGLGQRSVSRKALAPAAHARCRSAGSGLPCASKPILLNRAKLRLSRAITA